MVAAPPRLIRIHSAETSRRGGVASYSVETVARPRYQADGVGLAATQVGIGRRFFVYNPTGARDRKDFEAVVANPRIFEYSDETVVEEESCLSSRSETCAGMVRRSEWIRVKFQDAVGRQTRKKLEGFAARVFQHEYDHIEGVLHFDRFSEKDRTNIQSHLDALVEAHGPGGSLELDSEKLASLQPRPGRVPAAPGAAAAATLGVKKKKKAPVSAGFGGGGGGGAKKKAKKR